MTFSMRYSFKFAAHYKAPIKLASGQIGHQLTMKFGTGFKRHEIGINQKVDSIASMVVPAHFPRREAPQHL